MRIAVKLLKTLVVLVLIGGVSLFAATQFFGLRVELAGNGMTPVFSFEDPDDHYKAIEADRAENPAPPPAEPQPEPATESANDSTPQQAQAAAPAKTSSAPWPDYRGPRRDGVYRQTSIRTDWPAGGLRELWRKPIGGGYASMVVADQKIFTIEQRRGDEVTAAYDLETGAQLWEHSWPELFEESMGGPGPRATPTWADGKLYTLGAAGELRCLDASTGAQIWRTNILDDAGTSNVRWAMSGAPLVDDGKVIVSAGGRAGKAVTAYDAQSGAILWQSGSYPAGYSSPQIETLAGRRQLLVFMGTGMLSLDPASGDELWFYPWENSTAINSAQPLAVDQDHLWFSSGYGKGSTLVHITDEGGKLQAEKVWESNSMKNRFNSSVLHDGVIYGFDESIMAAIDARTGERLWKGGRYGYGQLLLAGDHIIVLTEQGDLALVKATPDAHQEVARFQALEGKTWNVPAIADGKLLVRNQTEMAAYALGG